MSTPIIVKDISKTYFLFSSPLDRIKQFFGARILRKDLGFSKPHHALKNVSFQVEKGQTIGIIGQNGSGKSTLLQMICGTLRQTSGDIQINGRISALLELGAGFNPEFTGRENLYLNAAILGLEKEEIDDAFDKIVAFADIGTYLDRPIRTYSSGMVVRLAFAIAIHVNPEILVIDEALAVGDEGFQRKCFAYLEDFKKQGGTILFVSHSAEQVVRLCDQALLLDKGDPLLFSDPRSVMNAYHKLLFALPENRDKIRDQIMNQDFVDDTKKSAHKKTDFFDPTLIPESAVEYQSRGARIEDLHVTNAKGDRVNLLDQGKKYRIQYRVTFDKDASHIACGTLIKTTDGVAVCSSTTRGTDQIVETVKSGKTIHVTHEFTCHLLPGSFFMNAGVSSINDQSQFFLHRIVDGYMFKVLPNDTSHMTGLANLGFKPKVKKNVK